MQWCKTTQKAFRQLWCCNSSLKPKPFSRRLRKLNSFVFRRLSLMSAKGKKLNLVMHCSNFWIKKTILLRVSFTQVDKVEASLLWTLEILRVKSTFVILKVKSNSRSVTWGKTTHHHAPPKRLLKKNQDPQSLQSPSKQVRASIPRILEMLHGSRETKLLNSKEIDCKLLTTLRWGTKLKSWRSR